MKTCAPTISKTTFGNRPRFSVMIPTYESGEKLCDTLKSVLEQDPGRNQMQISIVDDGSKRSDIQALIRQVDTDNRIEFVCNENRLGLCGNWNRAIELARGELVHLLHQDDYVLPGFYARMDRAFQQAPEIGMAFCRSRIIDGSDRLMKTSSREKWRAGVLSSWILRISERQRIQTPSVIVARKTYEEVGGYEPSLKFALDWEMWVRIASKYSVWYDPAPLAAYRRHSESETSRLDGLGLTWIDLIDAIQIIKKYLPNELQSELVQNSYRWHAHSAVRSAYRMYHAGNLADAEATVRSAHHIFGHVNSERRFDLAYRRLRNLELLLNRSQTKAA